jgi:predicted enzyme related to lactoylglutathione lyase
MARKLVGVIITARTPETLAEFYRSVLGIPYELRQHGSLPAHWECDLDGVHFAIIRGATGTDRGNVTPSYAVEDLEHFLEEAGSRGIHKLHDIIELGGGPRICTIADPEGNPVRLYEAA